MNAYAAILASPLGPLGIAFDSRGRLRQLDILAADRRAQAPAGTAERRVAAALEAYFQDPSQVFDIPLAAAGTPYQQRVWAALRRLPPGRVCTYGELARRLHSSPRAVGQACRRNPVPIIVPCHRVIASQDLGGYNGARQGPELAVKRWLLCHEGYLPDDRGLENGRN